MKSCVKTRRGYTYIEVLAVTGVIFLIGALVLPAVQSARESARRMSCRGNLKQLGLALHNYHDSHGTFPPGWIGVDNAGNHEVSGGSGWAWGGMLLPFMEQAPLNQQSNYRAKVGDSSNDLARSTTIAGFMCPSDGVGGPLWKVRSNQGHDLGKLPKANYVGVFGAHDPLLCQQFIGRGVQCVPEFGEGIFYHNSSVNLANILDGATNTLMVGERKTDTEKFPEWHSTWVGVLPQGMAAFARVVGGSNEPPNSKKGKLSNFSSSHGDMSQFVFADGRVRAIPNTISPNVFRLISSTTATTQYVSVSSAGGTISAPDLGTNLTPPTPPAPGTSTVTTKTGTPKIIDATTGIDGVFASSLHPFSSVGLVGSSSFGDSCTGTIIADNIVLTAAHCVNSLGGTFLNDTRDFDGTFTFVYGNVQDDIETGDLTITQTSTTVESTYIYVHPAWSGIYSPDFGTDNQHDIAIMFLEESISSATDGEVYIPPSVINGMKLDITIGFPLTKLVTMTVPDPMNPGSTIEIEVPVPVPPPFIVNEDNYNISTFVTQIDDEEAPGYTGDNSENVTGFSGRPYLDPTNFTVPEVGDVLTLAGYGSFGTGEEGAAGDFGTFRYGFTPIDDVSDNLISWDFENTLIDASDAAFDLGAFPPSFPPLLVPESNTAPGDSGGPAFGPDGTIWGITSGGSSASAGFGDTSFDTRLDPYLGWINSLTSAFPPFVTLPPTSTGIGPPGWGVVINPGDTHPFF